MMPVTGHKWLSAMTGNFVEGKFLWCCAVADQAVSITGYHGGEIVEGRLWKGDRGKKDCGYCGGESWRGNHAGEIMKYNTDWRVQD